MVKNFIRQFARLDWVCHPVGCNRFEAAAPTTSGRCAEVAAGFATDNMS